MGDVFRLQAAGKAEIQSFESLCQYLPIAGGAVTCAGIDQR